MADWTIGGIPTADQRAQLAEPFDPSTSTTVLTGERDGIAWELRDGLHAVPGHHDAVGHELITRGPRGNARAGAVGPRLVDGTHLEVGGSRAGGGGTEIAMLTVRCGPNVTTVRTRHVDGTTSDAVPVVSGNTGERWVVVALAGTAHVETVTALDVDGGVLATRSPTDPRVRAARPMPRPTTDHRMR